MDYLVKRHGRMTEVTVSPDPSSNLDHFEGYGQSLRSKADVASAKIGETIALGRALQDLGRQIEQSGHAQCVTKDEMARVKRIMQRGDWG